MAIDDTPAGVSANSYIDDVDAQAYFDTRLNTDAWDDADSISQEEALLQACQILEQLDYVGQPATSTQALQWPRLADDGVTLIRNFAITANPDPVRKAQCEVALWLLQTGGSGVAVGAGTVESVQIGQAVTVKYAQPTSGETAVDTAGVDYSGLPLQAARFLKGLRLHSLLA